MTKIYVCRKCGSENPNPNKSESDIDLLGWSSPMDAMKAAREQPVERPNLCWNCNTKLTDHDLASETYLRENYLASLKETGNWSSTPHLVIELLDHQLEQITLTTTNQVPGKKIGSIIEIVSAECVQGTNFISDFFADISDVLGGRSGAMESELEAARAICMRDIRRKAWRLDADAVVGVKLDYSELGGGDRKSVV